MSQSMPAWVNGMRRLMTDEQINQLADLLGSVMENGFGELVIVVINGKVKCFRPQLSIMAYYHREDAAEGIFEPPDDLPTGPAPPPPPG